jgi:CPA2 family monovalent cation:H+ antiporter-2
MRRVIRIVQDQRDARYNMLRGYFHGADDDSVAELEHERLATVTLALGAHCLGKPLLQVGLPGLNVRLVALRTSRGKAVSPDDDTVLGAGDTLVLSGKPEALALAEKSLLAG